MVDLSVYVERLRKLKETNPSEYNKMMTYYQSTYPDIYAKLVQALSAPSQAQAAPTKTTPAVNPSFNVASYASKLRELRMQSLDKYNQSLDYYKTNYPSFYEQLIKELTVVSKPTGSAAFKEFVNEYKFYLVAIFVGIGVIIYLLYLLMTR